LPEGLQKIAAPPDMTRTRTRRLVFCVCKMVSTGDDDQQRPPISLAAAIAGVVARLVRAGYIRREPDPHHRRQQILHP